MYRLFRRCTHITFSMCCAVLCVLFIQEVCEHYEGILKIISLLKQLVSNVPGVGRKVKTSGIIVLLPDAEKLSSAIHSSCVNLIQHIVEQARPFLGGLSPHSKEKKSKEVCTRTCSVMCITCSVMCIYMIV